MRINEITYGVDGGYRIMKVHQLFEALDIDHFHKIAARQLERKGFDFEQFRMSIDVTISDTLLIQIAYDVDSGDWFYTVYKRVDGRLSRMKSDIIPFDDVLQRLETARENVSVDESLKSKPVNVFGPMLQKMAASERGLWAFIGYPTYTGARQYMKHYAKIVEVERKSIKGNDEFRLWYETPMKPGSKAKAPVKWFELNPDDDEQLTIDIVDGKRTLMTKDGSPIQV